MHIFTRSESIKLTRGWILSNKPPLPLSPLLCFFSPCPLLWIYPIFASAFRSTHDYSYFQFTDINYDALSMQTTAITLLCSVLFLIFIFVSSIFVWKWVKPIFFYPILTNMLWSHEVAWWIGSAFFWAGIINLNLLSTISFPLPPPLRYRFKRTMPYKTSYAATDRNLEASLHFNEYDSADGVNARFKQGMDHHHQSHHFIVSTTTIISMWWTYRTNIHFIDGTKNVFTSNDDF